MILSLALPRASSRPYDLSPTLAAVQQKDRTGEAQCLCCTAAASRAPAHAVYGLYLDLGFQTRLCYSNTLRWDSVQSCGVLCGGRDSVVSDVSLQYDGLERCTTWWRRSWDWVIIRVWRTCLIIAQRLGDVSAAMATQVFPEANTGWQKEYER